MARTVIDAKTRSRSRELRKAMTREEVLLWLRLRELNGLGTRFRRQAAVGRYIGDFVWFGGRIVVECDGDQHGNSRRASDAARDAWLRSEGFLVLRFWNTEINDNIDGVMAVIHREALMRLGAGPQR